MIFGANKKGMTLIEVLIAVSLFTIATIIASSIFLKVVRLEKQSSIEKAVYEDVSTIMQVITEEIQGGTIDYDEYFNVCVIQNACNCEGESCFGSENLAFFGINHGVYGSRFYNPGLSLDGAPTSSPYDLGLECSYPASLVPGQKCEVIYSLSADLNNGRNPYDKNLDETSANAVCDSNLGKGICDDPSEVSVDYLFLLDRTGTKKTILAKKKVHSNSWAIGKVELDGLDLDQNGFVDVFTCAEGYRCYGKRVGSDTSQLMSLYSKIKLPLFKSLEDFENYGITVPLNTDLNSPFYDNHLGSYFIPVTPLRTNIVDLKFIIHPIEDPYRAYAETQAKSHPTVTIILTLDLNDDYENEYPGDFAPITVQTTVAAGVVGEIETYPPVYDNRLDSNDPSWIEDALNAGQLL